MGTCESSAEAGTLRDAAERTDAQFMRGLMRLKPWCARELDAASVSWPSTRPFAGAIGPFQFELAQYHVDPQAPHHLTVHARNCYRPESPFDHADRLRTSLLSVLDEAGERRPDVEWIQCGSWLNSLPSFAALFPPIWREAARRDVDRRGALHERMATQFRRTGQFPFAHLLCRYRIEQLRRHLQSV